MAKADRNNDKVSVFVVDIDDFKKINDLYGHEAGDLVIQSIANTLLKNIRSGDLVARWGGDEFLIIMPYSDEMCPLVLLERIDADLEKASFKLELSISISIGKAVYPDHAQNLGELIKYADNRMYQQKYEKKQ